MSKHTPYSFHFEKNSDSSASKSQIIKMKEKNLQNPVSKARVFLWI